MSKSETKKSQVVHVISKKSAFSAIVFICAFVLLTLGIFRKKRAFPNSIIFSLTRSQILKGKSVEDFLTSITESRFQKFFDSKNVLIEVRSFRSIFSLKSKLTFDTPFYLMATCLKRRYYFTLAREFLRAVRDSRVSEGDNLGETKRKLFDLPIYKVIGNQTTVRIDLVTTNSSLILLPSAFRSQLKGKRIMLWYSSNSKPISNNYGSPKLLWNPEYIAQNVDIHLVWTSYDETFLRKLGMSEIYAIGSIIFQPRQFVERSSQDFVITYFDVTPFASSFEWQPTGNSSFYSEENAISNLEKIAELSAYLLALYGNKIIFRLKPKRTYGKFHSQRYVVRVKQLTAQFAINLLDPEANLYAVTSQSDLVIATPWTSPAVLARELDVDSVFFSSSGREWKLPSKYEGIRVCKSLDELKNVTLSHIETKFISRLPFS